MPFTDVSPAPAEAFVPARFSCSRARGSGAAHVTLTGELDIATVSEVDRTLRRAESDADLVVLDCRALEFIDSGGAHLLVATARRIRARGGRFIVVVRYGDDVEWLLALTGTDRELELTDLPPVA